MRYNRLKLFRVFTSRTTWEIYDRHQDRSVSIRVSIHLYQEWMCNAGATTWAWSIAPVRKIKDGHRLSVSDRNDPRRTPTKRASTITKITAAIRTGAVAAGTRLIYLLSNIPTSPSTLFTSPSGRRTRRTQKRGFHIRSWDQWILSARDLLHRSFRRDTGVTVKTPLSARRSTHQPPLCHPDRGARGSVYEIDRKKCKWGRGYTRPCLAAWRGKIALSAADIFHADESGEGETKISSGIQAKDHELERRDKTCTNL